MASQPGASTVRDLVEEAAARLAEAGGEDPRRDAQALLSAVLGIPRSHLMAHPEELIPSDERARYRAAVMRRAAREPFAYVVGHKEFFGLDFEVTPAVLIPRPETELLVERAIDATRRLLHHGPGELVAVDLGTGSGAIAVSLATQASNVRVIAVDSSPEAIAVARRNAERHGIVDLIEFRRGDLLSVVPEPFDLLLGNLPYIRSGEVAQLMPEVSRYEPRSALDGGPDGTLLIKRALSQVAERTEPPRVILFEIGDGQGADLERYAAHLFPDTRIGVERDYAGRERLLSIWRTR